MWCDVWITNRLRVCCFFDSSFINTVGLKDTRGIVLSLNDQLQRSVFIKLPAALFFLLTD